MSGNSTQAKRKNAGAHMVMFLDRDIARIACVMRASLTEGRRGSLL
jgi:hypothetical protein